MMMSRWLTVFALTFAVTWSVDTCHGEPPVSRDAVPLGSWRLNSDSRRELVAATFEIQNRSNDVYWKLNERFKSRVGFVATSSKATMMWVISSHLHELLRLRLDQTQLGHARVQTGVEDLTELHFELKRDLRAWGVDMNTVPNNAATGLQLDLQKLESALDGLSNVVRPEPAPLPADDVSWPPPGLEPAPAPAAPGDDLFGDTPSPPKPSAAVPDPIKVN